eukprot:jgi/Chrpa1/10405/Chrysochromulina_OHIO_Genome00004275-RA
MSFDFGEFSVPTEDGEPQRLSWRDDPERSLSDWTIIVTCGARTQTFNVHKVMLAAGVQLSEYFKSVFTGGGRDLREGISKTTTLELEETAADAFPHYLDFAYTALGSTIPDTLQVKLLSEALKVGRLRPDFLARCVPVNGVCTGVASVVEEGRRSFPSGHSALSFAGLGFVSLCLGARLVQAPGRSGALWKLCVVALPWLLALHVALSRVADYWHHWEDVLVGSLLGHVAAYTTYRLRFVAPSAGLVPHYHLYAAHGGEVPDKRRAHTSPPEHV